MRQSFFFIRLINVFILAMPVLHCSWAAHRLLPSCSAQASQCSGLSRCGAGTPGRVAPIAAAPGP